jgi:hypothetical protein
MSVVVVDVVERVSNIGKKFIALIVQSELQIVQSANGNVYCAVRKASIPSTLESLETAKMMLGKELPGTIQKVECAPYDRVTENGELITLNHRYSYVPESNRVEIHTDEVLEYQELEEELVH